VTLLELVSSEEYRSQCQRWAQLWHYAPNYPWNNYDLDAKPPAIWDDLNEVLARK